MNCTNCGKKSNYLVKLVVKWIDEDSDEKTKITYCGEKDLCLDCSNEEILGFKSDGLAVDETAAYKGLTQV